MILRAASCTLSVGRRAISTVQRAHWKGIEKLRPYVPPTDKKWTGNVEDTPNDAKHIEVALMGAANAGKSTLLNAIMMDKVSIVSPKAQTTRNDVVAVHTEGNKQIIFHDTPGLKIKPLGHWEVMKSDQINLTKETWRVFRNVDNVLVILDAIKGIDPTTQTVLEQLSERVDQDKQMMADLASNPNLSKLDPDIKPPQLNPPSVIITKMDAVKNTEYVAGIAEELLNKYNVKQVFLTSVTPRKVKGVDILIKSLQDMAQSDGWKFAPNVKSLQNDLDIVTEVIREKAFLFLNKEIPYNISQENEYWKEFPNGDLVIRQVLYVPQTSMKARRDLSHMWKRKVHLFLEVKNRKAPKTTLPLVD